MRVFALVCGCAAVLLAAPVQAHEVKQKNLQIVHPWAHESTDKTATSADVYMIIRNLGKTPDRLVSAATQRAGRVELVAVMPDAFLVVAGKEAALNQASGFVRLLGLKKPLYMHDNFPLTLVFEKAGRIKVDVHIEEVGVAEPPKH